MSVERISPLVLNILTLTVIVIVAGFIPRGDCAGMLDEDRIVSKAVRP